MKVVVYGCSNGEFPPLSLWRNSLKRCAEFFPMEVIHEQINCPRELHPNAEYGYPAWYWYTANKLNFSANAMEKAECDVFVFSDCDIVFFPNPAGWEQLFKWFSSQGVPVAYMRNHEAADEANSGLYMVKGQHLKRVAQFNRMLHGMATSEDLKYGDQTALNFMRPLIRNALIPRDFTFETQPRPNLVFYHGVGGGLGKRPVQLGGTPNQKFYQSKVWTLENKMKIGMDFLASQKV